ncbi:Ku protein [Acuticoccus sediminis]|uniref:Non-homologous end joining protein Ku n=1 Tax=Acuticoccus sediminis TaxID=2184697 RepID=A0A8B2NSL6_9HYPH|nr:Ku protein [Acuticoccus sediminis]RAI00444.1 Ku protein [Acuticoccus sediminis]
MAPRAYWKGHIRLALVSFPVRLYAATTSTERISLHRIHKETHERVRIQNVVPDEGPVDRDDIVMGYEYDRDKYVPVTEEELDAIEVESKHTIDLSRFVRLDDIDPIYFDKPYFVAPDGDIAAEAFVTIRDALRASKKVALGQIVLAKRERVVAIQPCGEGMLLETLRFADEVRESNTYFEDIEDVSVSRDQVEMAESLIEARSGAFDPNTFVDHYQQALKALIESKLKGKKVEPPKPAKGKGSNVINLMDALKASLESKEGSAANSNRKSTRKASAKSPSKASSSKSAGAKSSKAASASSAAKASGTTARRTTGKTATTRQKKSA